MAGTSSSGSTERSLRFPLNGQALGPVLLLHGGVGRLPEAEVEVRLQGVQRAAELAHRKLLAGSSALEAAVAAVESMEDAPLLNAGRDGALNLDGEAEADASIMDSQGNSGAVGAVRGFRHPIRLALEIARRTDHQLLVGEGARRLGLLLGLEESDARTPRSLERHRYLLDRLKESLDGRLPDVGFAWKRLPEIAKLYEEHGTVGAVALDDQGGLAAATSTGGIWLKLPGRVGDTAILGAGTYCDSMAAASATGFGEGILRLGTCRQAVLNSQDAGVQKGALAALTACSRQNVECGLLLLGADGQFSAVHNAHHMPVVLVHGPESQLTRSSG